jgi:hypothetical protein
MAIALPLTPNPNPRATSKSIKAPWAQTAPRPLGRIEGCGPDPFASNIVVRFNRIVGNLAGGIAIIDGYSGVLDAENNWWGCNTGPDTTGCDAVNINIDANPWLTLRLSAAPSSIFVGSHATLTADLTVNSNGADTSAAGYLLDGMPIAFSGTLGSVAPASAGTVGGKAQSRYTAGTIPGSASASAQLDNALVTAPLTLNPRGASATTLASSANPTLFGQAITLTASISAIPAGSGTHTGTVTFRRGVTVLGTSPLNGVGQATLSNVSLGVGSHQITAFYSGNTAFELSDNSATPLVQVVGKANMTTTIYADAPDPSPIGREVTIQFSVSGVPSFRAPTGSVTVSASGQSCTGALSGGEGSCNITLSAIGPSTLVATYSGDRNFNGSSISESHELIYFKLYIPVIRA